MNTIITTPDVKLFVAAVRDHLTDLTEEEREELVGGLEGDMSDLVEERGVDALPEPSEYAAELRSAAGFPDVAARERTGPRELRGRVTHWLDRGTATWSRWVEDKNHWGLPALAQSLRPVWWVLRALCATALAIELRGGYELYGFTLNRVLLALVAILVSVQIGRGAWWPGTMLSRSLVVRVLVIGLNLFAVVLIPVMAQRLLITPQWLYADDTNYNDLSSQSLTFHGNPVRNVYAYDAQGHPLTGVQLVDQDGRRLMVERDPWDDATQQQYRLQPWLNGRTELYSVFPLPEQKVDASTGSALADPRIQVPPFASLPRVTLTGVQPSVLLTPAQVEAQKKAAAKAAARAKAAEAHRKNQRKQHNSGPSSD